MVIFIFFKVKSDPNIHQMHELKNFWRTCPRTPQQSAACCFATCEFPNLKKIFLAPLPNPGYVPDVY